MAVESHNITMFNRRYIIHLPTGEIGKAVLIRQFSGFMKLFGALRHSRLLLAKASIESHYLGFSGEGFSYDKELAEEVLTYLKSYNRVTGRCKTFAASPRVGDCHEAPAAFTSMLQKLTQVQNFISGFLKVTPFALCPFSLPVVS